MSTITVTRARNNLTRLIDQVRQDHEPIVITGKRGNAVLLAEEDWRAVQETLFLLDIPGVRETVCEGLPTPLEACQERFPGE